MTEDVLGAVFCISRVTVDRYYNCWIRVMDEMFNLCFRRWPYTGQAAVPPAPKLRSLFPRVDLIVDCFEIKIETPRNPDAARKCYSQYKKGYTIKVLIGVEGNGNPCFCSHIYQGSISDIAIVKASGLFTKLERGSVVLADRGSILVEFAKNFGVNWIVPPSVYSGEGMTSDELKDTHKIARVRIIVERAIGRLKKWAQLHGPLLISDLGRLDIEIRVILHLCKFLPPLIRNIHSEMETLPDSAVLEDYDSSKMEHQIEDANLLLNFANASLSVFDLLTSELCENLGGQNR